ncbi:MAG: hypothetical protein LDLANPLL_02587 [Turneriella sp.]|nr:hypothetical protein [Turneriella sp.]
MRFWTIRYTRSARQPLAWAFVKRSPVILSLCLAAVSSSCQLQVPGDLLDKVPAPQLSSFSISGVAGVIGTNTIQVDLRWVAGSKTNLKPVFSASTELRVNGVKQISGVTAQNFTQNVVYTLANYDGEDKEYTVSVQAGYPFADTGQTLCYDTSAATACTGSGGSYPNQDADFADIPAARSFTGPTAHAVYTSDYTTTDNVTGLVWKTCSEGLSGSSCTGTVSNLNFTAATTACSALNSANGGKGYAGYTAWRLPNVQELSTLSLFDGTSPAVSSLYFPNTATADYFTSTAYAPDTSQYWSVYTGTATSGYIPNSTAMPVRCVVGRGTFTPVFSDLGDGTVHDTGTRLYWQKCSRGQNNDATCSGSITQATWTQALTYCAGLSLAGKTWRLPNVRELQTIVDYTASGPSINATYFPATGSGVYWSSSTYSSSPASARDIEFSNGRPYYQNKTAASYVRCVSGP